jgi:hypothetical protein
MSEQENRNTLERFFQALARHDLDIIDDLVHDDYVEEYPQLGERISGKQTHGSGTPVFLYSATRWRGRCFRAPNYLALFLLPALVGLWIAFRRAQAARMKTIGRSFFLPLRSRYTPGNL